MIAVVFLILLAIPVIGAVAGYGMFAVAGAWTGGLVGTVLAVALVALPFRLLVDAEKAKSRAPRPPPPDVPWL